MEPRPQRITRQDVSRLIVDEFSLTSLVSRNLVKEYSLSLFSIAPAAITTAHALRNGGLVIDYRDAPLTIHESYVRSVACLAVVHHELSQHYSIGFAGSFADATALSIFKGYTNGFAFRRVAEAGEHLARTVWLEKLIRGIYAERDKHLESFLSGDRVARFRDTRTDLPL
jgi:hypothetical protein